MNTDSQPSKRRRISITLPRPTETVGVATWVSKYNLDGKVQNSNTEVGDGATSRVYKGTLDGNTVAVKHLKHYSPARLSSVLIKCYQPMFHLENTNLVKILGICPKAGQIVMEYCEKVIEGYTVHTLNDILVQLGNRMPVELRLLALCDVAEGLSYLHSEGVVHGDIKPHNILVSGKNEGDYNFKITDYSGISSGVISQLSSRSSSLKQFMMPGYLAPELIGDVGDRLPPSKPSDIYSFGILTYEVYFCAEPWPNVSMQLLNAIRRGHRPVIPSNAPEGIVNIIKECWQHDRMLRPNASEVSRLMQEQLEAVSSISSMQDDLDDTSIMPISNYNSPRDVEMCAGQNRYSTSSIHDEDAYADLNNSSNSHINESVNTDLVVSEETVIYQMNIETASENPEHVQMITDGTANYTISSFCSDLVVPCKVYFTDQ